jgi:hypothetical protein
MLELKTHSHANHRCGSPRITVKVITNISRITTNIVSFLVWTDIYSRFTFGLNVAMETNKNLSKFKNMVIL